VLKQLGIGVKTTFSGLYEESIAKQVLLHYWQQVTDGLAIIMMTSDNYSDLYCKIMQSQKKPKLNKTLYWLASMVLIEQTGIRDFQNKVEESANKTTWYRIKKQLKSLNLPHNHKYTALSSIQKCLVDFQPLKLADYKLQLKVK
jgi:hypothetical protein